MEELFQVHEDIRDMEANLKRDRSALSEMDVKLYENEIASAKKREDALKFRCFHLQDELRAISRYTGGGVDPETVETWVYEWTYDPYDFSYDMNQEEIYYRAIKELYSIGETKIHAMANCGVRAKRCTTEELIDMCRWYSSPVSSERYKLSDIKNSSFFDDVTSDDPLERARKRAVKEIDDQAQMAFLQALGEAAAPTKNETGATVEDKMDEALTVDKPAAPPVRIKGQKLPTAAAAPQKQRITRAAGRRIVRASDVIAAEVSLAGENLIEED